MSKQSSVSLHVLGLASSLSYLLRYAGLTLALCAIALVSAVAQAAPSIPSGSVAFSAPSFMHKPWWQQAMAMADTDSEPNAETTAAITNTSDPNFTLSPNLEASLSEVISTPFTDPASKLKAQKARKFAQLPPCCRQKLSAAQANQVAAKQSASQDPSIAQSGHSKKSNHALTFESNCLEFYRLTYENQPQYDWDGSLISDATTGNTAEGTDAESDSLSGCASASELAVGSLPCCQPQAEKLTPQELQQELLKLQYNSFDEEIEVMMLAQHQDTTNVDPTSAQSYSSSCDRAEDLIATLDSAHYAKLSTHNGATCHHPHMSIQQALQNALLRATAFEALIRLP